MLQMGQDEKECFKGSDESVFAVCEVTCIVGVGVFGGGVFA